MNKQRHKETLDNLNHKSILGAQRDLFDDKSVSVFEVPQSSVTSFNDVNQNHIHTVVLQGIHAEDSDNSDYSDEIDKKKFYITRRRTNHPETCKINVVKSRREKCMAYTTKNKSHPAKAPKFDDCSKCKFKCTSNITEEDRQKNCKLYWGFCDFGRKKDFILKFVQAEPPKLYINSDLSIWKMYNLYRNDFCKERNITEIVSEKTYRRIFCDNYNYSFFKPKKDLCTRCAKYDQAINKNELEAELSMQLMRKKQCTEAKENDKLRCKNDPAFITCTFDLQSVLQLPYSSVSLFYYSRKICVYNLTIYVGSGENAHCYTWNELNGKRGSNEIGSILFRFLKTLPLTVTDVSLFCDTCVGQNRNQQVAAVLMYAVKHLSHLNRLELKILESGHSHIRISQSARSSKKDKKKGEYQVHLLKFADFYNLQELAATTIKNRNKDECGEKVSGLKIKCFKFKKEFPEILYYRYDHTSDYKKINVSGRGRRRTIVELKSAYCNLLPISQAKKTDLVKLCDAGLIP